MESNSFLKVGTLLNHAKYRIEQYLASGGFGNTYEGVNVSLDKKCAIKEFFLKGVVLRDEHTSQVFITHPDNKKAFNSQKEKFTKEARRLSRLDNSHIVRVFDFFEENGTAYYVMDYIEGVSLREYQKRTGKALTEREALSVLTQMLDALETIHDAGLLHMDIKPANIMIDNKGKCTLIDFGASKQPSVSDGATTSSAMAYTPGFAPTEQIGGSSDRWGPWTDFYALGATLYNLLTNKNPANLDIEVDGADAFKFPPNVSDSMRSLIQWLMTPKRTERPQNVDAIRNCLNQLELNVGRPLSIKEGNQPLAGNQPAGELIPEPKESTADAESTEIESAEVAEPAEPKNEIDSKAMDSGDITEPTAPMADTEVPEAEEASQEEATCIEAEKALDSSTDAAAPETADSSSNENDNASEGEGAPISFPNDNRDVKKKKGHLGKWVAVALFSLLLIGGSVFFISNTDSKKEPEPKAEQTPNISFHENSEGDLVFTIDSVSFTMIYVPGGSFTMGATAEQGADAADEEKPTFDVSLTGFYIGETEVTQALWKAMVWDNPSIFKGDQRPVESVSWYDCQLFIQRLNAKTGKKFRLPTEAEWEYAARGGDSGGTKYAGSDNINSIAWYDKNAANETHNVATKSPNSLGIYDMSGNVSEWCNDRYDKYSGYSQDNPMGPSYGEKNVCRGGSWISSAWGCRVSYRSDAESPKTSYYYLGFRLALSL